MNADVLGRLRNLFLVAEVVQTGSPAGNPTDRRPQEATVRLQNQTLTGVPILHPAGLKQTLQPGSKALLLCPAGEVDHAALIPLDGAPEHQLYERFNALLQSFNDLLNALHSNALNQVKGGDDGASAAAYLMELKGNLETLQSQFNEQFSPPDNPLGFLLEEE